MTEIKLRTGSAADYDTLGEVMFDAIHNGPSKYTNAQSNAWAPIPRSGPEWASRLSQKDVIIAEHGRAIMGFMTIEPGGYVDFAYIRPSAQGSGLFRRLFAEVMKRAEAAGETELTTHASLMAQPAFAAMGFKIDFHETVEVDGQKLARARMIKTLQGPAMTDYPISGIAAPGFEPVLEAFEANFTEDKELGAGFSAYLDGELIVDLHGGFADRKKERAWDAQTVVPIYSTTKPIAALTLAHVIDALPAGYETAVADLWPEFGANGKDAVTIAELVSHQAGLPGFVDPVDPALWLDPSACSATLAPLAPLWEPGTQHGYHPLTWGYLIGEIVRRIDGRTLGTVLREEIAGPAAIDFQIGTPASDHHRVAEIMRPRALPDLGEINDATRAAFLTKWAAPDRGGAIWREIEIPSANGIGTAKAVAQLYGIYTHGGQLADRRVVSEAAFEALTQSRVKGQDLVLPYVTEFAAGVMRNNIGLYGPNPETLCHSGWGGSLALGDPDRGLSLAYVMSRQSNSLQADPRATRLVQALYGCL